MSTVFIYALNDPDTGLTRYVGKAVNPKRRLKAHCFRADTEKDHRSCWISSLLKAGKRPALEILDEVPEELWPQWEVAWIEFFQDAGFDLVNSAPGGNAPPRMCGEDHPMFGKHGAENPNFGRKLSEDQIAGMRARGKGNKHCLGKRNMLGHSHSGETRLKMSLASKGRSKSPEHCANIRAGQLGRAVPREWVAKRKLSMKLKSVFGPIYNLAPI